MFCYTNKLRMHILMISPGPNPSCLLTYELYDSEFARDYIVHIWQETEGG